MSVGFLGSFVCTKCFNVCNVFLLMSLEGFKGGHRAGFHIKNKINYPDSLMNKTWTCLVSLRKERERERER
jgi:hypothetical protein